jgi:arylsulfatase A-like enzyme
LICRWPGKIQPGSVSDELICLGDLMATCAAIVGVTLSDDAGEDSYSILPAMLGKELESSIRPSLIHHSGAGVFSIRQGPWKLILETLGSGGWPPPRGGPPQPGSPGQLYHMANDPAEACNLWDERPQVIERLSALLQEYRNQGRSTFSHRTWC